LVTVVTGDINLQTKLIALGLPFLDPDTLPAVTPTTRRRGVFRRAPDST
jgi:hypothetical protein